MAGGLQRAVLAPVMDAKRIDTVENVALVDKANVPKVPMLFKGPQSFRTSGRQTS